VSGELATFAGRARAALVVLSAEASFSHLTAARMMAIAFARAPGGNDDLHFTVPRKGARRRHAGFVEHHDDRAGVTWGDLPLVAAADARVYLAAVVQVRDVVIAGDHLLHGECAPARI